MYLEGQSVAVIGGGVAGLTVATACARRGARVTVHEQAPEITEVGAGLQISPNGMRVLEALGLADTLRSVSLAAEGVVLRNGSDARRVLRLDLTGRDYHFVHRARLIDVLETGARAAGVEIRLGEAIAPDPELADIVVGADGLHSRTRAILNRDEPARFTGQVAWRAVIPSPSDDPVAQVFMGPGRHLVTYPLAGGLRNIVAVEERRDWAEEGWSQTDDPAHLKAAFAGFAPEVVGWFEQIETVHLWGLFQHPVAAAWYEGSIAILGDAAHPTLPFLAQGANMALEDAWVLADVLSQYPRETALRRYQQKRRDRTVRIVAAAAANARNYHLSNPLVRKVAHTALRLAGAVAPDAAIRRFDWLYEMDVTKSD